MDCLKGNEQYNKNTNIFINDTKENVYSQKEHRIGKKKRQQRYRSLQI